MSFTTSLISINKEAGLYHGTNHLEINVPNAVDYIAAVVKEGKKPDSKEKGKAKQIAGGKVVATAQSKKGEQYLKINLTSNGQPLKRGIYNVKCNWYGKAGSQGMHLDFKII